MSGRKRKKGVGTKGGTLSSRQHRLIIAALILLFVCIAAIRWSSELPIGSDCDEHMIVAQTFIRTGHFSVADIHATKYPPLTSSIAILFQYLGLNAPLSMVVLNCLAVLASALVVCSLILRPRLLGEDDPQPARLVSAESPATAVAVGDWVVVFATEGRLDSPVTYDAPEGTAHHLVVDLPPQSMWQVAGSGGAPTLSTGDEGVVSFDAGGGTIHLVEVPARGGEGHR